MPTVRADLAQGDEHEPSPVKARMWEKELQVFGLDREDLVLVKEEIEINGARAFGGVAFAPEHPFDLQTSAQQSDRIQPRAQGDNLVEEARLIADIHRLGLIEGGATLQCPVAGERLSRASQVCLSIAEI